MSEAAPPRRPPRGDKIDREGEALVLGLAKAGKKRDALEKLMNLYGDAITAHLTRLMRDGEIAKDLRQQTFVSAYQGLENFQERSSLRTWLFSIARNRAVDEMKRNRRAQLHDDFDVWNELAVQPEPSMRGEERARRLALEDCLGTLSEATRAQLLMRMSEGMTHKEIGEIVHEPHGTVQVRISRALLLLRKCLKRKGLGR